MLAAIVISAARTSGQRTQLAAPGDASATAITATSINASGTNDVRVIEN